AQEHPSESADGQGVAGEAGRGSGRGPAASPRVPGPGKHAPAPAAAPRSAREEHALPAARRGAVGVRTRGSPPTLRPRRSLELLAGAESQLRVDALVRAE